jgi:hypothetical protein
MSTNIMSPCTTRACSTVSPSLPRQAVTAQTVDVTLPVLLTVGCSLAIALVIKSYTSHRKAVIHQYRLTLEKIWSLSSDTSIFESDRFK